MIWAGESMKVVVMKDPGVSGNFSAGATKRVFALRESNEGIQVLVGDDDGTPSWVIARHIKIQNTIAHD